MFPIIFKTIKLLSRNKKLAYSLGFANGLFAFLILLEPIFFKKVIDILITLWDTTSKSFTLLFSTLWVWVGIGLCTIFIRLYVSIYSDRQAHFYVQESISWFFNHTLDLSLRFHLNANSGQLVKKITRGVDGIFRIQLEIFRKALPSIFIVLIMIPLVLYLHMMMGLIVIIIWILSAFVTYFVSSSTFKKQENIEDIYSQLSTHYGDTFSNIPIVKSFVLSDLKKQQLKKLTDQRLKKQLPILVWWGAIVCFSQILKIIVSIVVISFGSYLYIMGEISLGSIVMFLSFSSIFLSAIEDLTWTLEGFFWNLASIKEYFHILETPIEVQDKTGAKKLRNVQGNITFEHVYFSYDGKRNILSDIHFEIQAGEKIAFVGHTGSGKTTMTHMLLRFFEPQQGDIKIDGISIYDVTQESLRKNIGIVFQDNSLFNTTVWENICLDTKASQADIERVAKKSHSSDFIKHLSDWFDTIVWERWVKLSGGEKQRLAIARAFLKDAPILILDEATSALDAQTEKYLQGSFDELMKNRTTFIIAHRLSTIMKADTIFVFDQWKIVERWSYEELMVKNGIFTKLVEAQTQGFIN